jgi:predicted transcriptional regulator
MGEDELEVKTTLREPISYRFRVVREANNHSIRWLSKMTGIPRKKIQQMESGTIPFTDEAKSKLAQAMNDGHWLEDYE